MGLNSLTRQRPLPRTAAPDIRRWRWPHISWLNLLLVTGAGLVAGLILVVPGYLVLRTAGAGLEAVELLARARTLSVLGNTLLLATAVTLATTLIAVPIAWLTTRTDLPGRRIWSVLTALPLVIPSYVAAFLYVSLLAPKGPLQQLLAPLGVTRLPGMTGFWGAFLVLTISSYPYVLLTVRAALKRLDPCLIEAARSLGQTPWQAFWRVTVPYLRPSILAGALLVALYVLRDFGAVTMLQYSTFTRVIYNRYMAYRLDTAAAMALVLVVITVVFLWLEARARGKARYARVSIGVARQLPPARLGIWKAPALLFVSAVVFVALVVPAVGLAYWFVRGLNQDFAVQTLGSGANNVAPLVSLLEPAVRSVSVALIGGLLAILAALPIAILAVRRPGRTSRFFEQLSYAGFALPGIVVALAFVFLGTNALPSLYQTLPMLLLAYVVLFVPQAVGAERASLLQVPERLEEAGRSLGKRPSAVLRSVTLPLLRPGILAGGTLVFLTIMKELPATLILSPIGFSTLAAQIWTNINEAFFARAAAPTLLLVLLSSLPLALLTLRDKDA